jgi:hypothetical protein
MRRETACEGYNLGERAIVAEVVPQVASPVTDDQPSVAARFAEKQTGVVTSLDKLTTDHRSALQNEVLSNLLEGTAFLFAVLYLLGAVAMGGALLFYTFTR